MKNNEACAKKKRDSDLSTGSEPSEGEIERVAEYIISSLIMGHTKPDGKCVRAEQSSSIWSDYCVTWFSAPIVRNVGTLCCWGRVASCNSLIIN